MFTKRLASVSLALSFLGLVGLWAACGGGNDNLPPPPPPPAAPNASANAAPVATQATTASATPVKPPAPPVVLSPGAPAPDPNPPTPTVKITAPAANQLLAEDKAMDFQVKLDVKNWTTAQGSSHVHLILDNKPYKAIYDTKAPVKISELANGEALKEGEHVLVAFPSRASHESVKTKDAFTIVSFWVGKKAGDPKTSITKKPMLIYSRPKGDYKGDLANHVLVDFYVHNVTLAEGKEHVSIAVTGPGIDKPLEGKVEKFGTPYYLDNLQNGSYELKLELRDASDKLIDGPWNSTTRKINVDHEAIPDMASAHGDHGAAADAGAPTKPAAKDAGAAPKGPGPGGAPAPSMTQTAPLMPTKP